MMNANMLAISIIFRRVERFGRMVSTVITILADVDPTIN